MSDGATTGKSLIVLALLIVVGFLGNYFTVPLFFGADFLFGSVAVFLVIYFYGLGWGMLAATIVYSYTYFLWGHPYGFINFTCEALFVGIFLRKGRRNLPGLDWAFWLLVGMPLVCIEHGVLMHMDAVTTSFIMLKQAINGIFNALLASLAICYLPLGRPLQRPQISKSTTLQASLCNLMVMMVLLPSLLLTMLQVKQEKANLEARVMAELQSLSTNMQLHLQSWLQFHQQALQALASLAGESSMTPSEELQHKTEVLKQSFPDFLAMQLEDAEGHTIAFDPKVNERGESTIGVNLSDRAWFQDARAKQQPVVSEVFMGRTASFFPIVDISVPVIRENRWLGCSTGTLDLGRIQKILQPYQSNKAAASLTLTDLQNRVIASTTPERTPMQSWNRKESGVSQVLDNMMYLWRPDDKGLPSMTRWTQSYYVQETSVGPELPWKLIAEAPVAPLQRVLYSVYVKNMAIMAFLTTLGLLLSHIFSRGLTRPLAKLAQVTADLPEKLSRAQEIDWPASSAEEFNSLIGNFKSMAKALETNFHRLQVQSDGLRQTAEALNLRESYLTAIIENQPGLLWLKDTEGRFLTINHAFVRSCGREKLEEVVGKTDLDVWPSELAEKYRSDDSEVMTRHAPTAVEECIIDQGVLKWFQTFRTPVFTTDGQVLGTCGFALDITERKRAEVALRENEELYRTLVNLSPDAISVADPNGLLTLTSPKSRQLFGDSPDDEILGSNILSWVVPEEQKKASANIRHLLIEGTLIDTEFTLLKKDGTSFIGEVNAAVIHSPDGRPMRIIIITRDITERKRAEQDLLESENKFKSFAENALVGIYLVQDGIFKYVNPKFAQMFGYTVEECLNDMHFNNLAYPEDLAKIEEQVRLRTSGEVDFFQHSFRGLKKNGQSFHVEVFASTSNYHGRPAATGTILDITERKRSDAERTLLATAVEQAEENILVTDNRRTIIYINPAFGRSSGYRLEDLKGKKLRVLRSDQHDEAFYRNMQETLDLGEVWMGVIFNKGKDGTDFEIEGTISPLKDASGSITHFVAAGRNMSRFRKLERELYQALKMESVGRLAGGVAHDFNNMLGVIIGRAEMALQQDVSNHKLQHNLKEILKAGLRSADLTRQLLAFARKQTAIPKILDLNDTIASMLEMLRRLIAEDINLSWQPGPDLWKVKIDPSQVDQILVNLAVNAGDAISGVGVITLRTENVVIDDSNRADNLEFVPGEYVQLTVNDTGEGMSKEIRENIFEPFFTTKELGKGTGLGLSTVYGIVKQNDGFIYVASEPGKGTSFKIYLPRFEVETAQVTSEDAAGKRPTGTETILLVEDDEAILNLSKMILEELGYTLIAAQTPVQAIHLAEDHPGDIHLLITDVVMPGMNGRELVEQLHTIRPDLKFLYMSGYTADLIAHRGIMDEGVNFIQKPFGCDDLAAKVRQVLGQLE